MIGRKWLKPCDFLVIYDKFNHNRRRRIRLIECIDQKGNYSVSLDEAGNR